MGTALKIYINGIITSEKVKEPSTSVDSIYEILKANADCTSIECIINSGGGNVREGLAIADLLSSQGKPLITKAFGICGSIATIIFLKGEKRYISPSCKFFIHNPYQQNVSGDAKEFAYQAENLNAIQNEMIAIYMKSCGEKLSEAQLREMMSIQTDVSSQNSVAYGFATDIWVDMNVTAYYNNIQINEKEMKKTESGFYARMKALFSGAKTQMFKATTNENAEVEITTASGDEKYAIGDMVVLVADGAPATGEHTLSDGNTIVVDASGIIAEIKPTAQAEAQKTIAELTAELAKAKELVATKEQEAKAKASNEDVVRANLVAEIAKANAKASEIDTNNAEMRKTINALFGGDMLKNEIDNAVKMSMAQNEKEKSEPEQSEIQKNIFNAFRK